jgi:hypothetical protein
MADEPIRLIEGKKRNLNNMLIPSDVFDGYRPERMKHWTGGAGALKDQGSTTTMQNQTIAAKKAAFKQSRPTEAETAAKVDADLEQKKLDEKNLTDRKKNEKIGGLMYQKQQLEGEMAHLQQRLDSGEQVGGHLEGAKQRYSGVMGEIQKSR